MIKSNKIQQSKQNIHKKNNCIITYFKKKRLLYQKQQQFSKNFLIHIKIQKKKKKQIYTIQQIQIENTVSSAINKQRSIYIIEQKTTTIHKQKESMPHSSTLHNHSYLYPCQLSSVFHRQKGGNNRQFFNDIVFYSPMDSYLNVYNLIRGESELVSLEGRRFSHMERGRLQYGAQLQLQLQQYQNDYTNGIILLTNTQEIVMIFNNSNEISVYPLQQQQYNQQLPTTTTTKRTILTHNVQQQQDKPQNIQIVSNALVIQAEMRYKNTTDNNNNNDKNKSFNLIYLTKTINKNNQVNNNNNHYEQQQQQIELNICQYEYDGNIIDLNSSSNSSIRGSDCYFKDDNPEEQFEHQSYGANQINKIHKIHKIPLYQLNNTSSIYHTLSPQFTLYQSERNEILVFDKLQERICLFDLEYGAITSVTQCSVNNNHWNIRDMRNGRNNNMLQIQGRKVAIFSNNLLLQYDSMAVVKVIDKRVNRIIQVRDLNEQFHLQQPVINNHNNNHNNNNHHIRQSPLYYQRFIKLWNPITNHTQNYHHQNNNNQSFYYQPTTFCINMNNKIVNVDLRYSNNNGAEDNVLFQIEKGKTIGDYDVGMSFDYQNGEEKRVVAYTVEDQLAFRSCVVVEGQGMGYRDCD